MPGSWQDSRGDGRPGTAGPGITVVIPSFNHGRFIDEAIRSLLDQNHPDLEIIVVDGGSTDDTVDRLGRYGSRILWSSERDRGQADALAKGFARATKPWLTWLNSDDIQCNGALAVVVETIGRRLDADVVFGRGHYIDEKSAFLSDYPTITLDREKDSAKALFESGYVAQPSVYFRRDLYRKVGGVDTSLEYVMDYELWVRFALAGATFVAIQRDISGNRWHQDAKTVAGLSELHAEAIKIQIRHYGKVSSYFVQAISDDILAKRHCRCVNASNVLFWRWIYFKAVWIRLNARSPIYCIRGLFHATIAKSGSVIGDRIRRRDWLRGLWSTLLRRKS
jgi:glycosyltransferase involved in cell wall biosynthesis